MSGDVNVYIDRCHPAGGGASIWEVIDDTTIAGTPANVTHSYDYADYSVIKVVARDIQGEAPANTNQLNLTVDGVNYGASTDGVEADFAWLDVDVSMSANTAFFGGFYGSVELGTQTLTLGTDHTPSGGTINIVIELKDSVTSDVINLTGGRVTTYGLKFV
jgi:hypothetical protein